ncbi:MAG: energy transducer TonB [Ignavibacteria bacterium]|nr:energy transducer TonB [Ignavibacteria bacterium]
MPVLKTPKADLKRKYQRVFEISLIMALTVLIIAFKFFPTFEGSGAEMQAVQELVNVEDIVKTKQENKPPPPPKPPIPIEAPSDDVLEDIEIGSTEIDLSQTFEAPPPPPKETKVIEEEVTYFEVVEDMPEPIGGIQAIQSKITYPEIAKRAGVEGKVYILAYVNEQGEVTKTEVLRGIGAGCDEAAEKAVRDTKFKPGKQRGKPVKVKVAVPIVFTLK